MPPILFDKPEPGESARRGPRRLWTLALAPKLPAETFDGLPILEEVRGTAAGLLFQCFRDALLWATAEPITRTELFRPESNRFSSYDVALDPRIAAAVEVLTRIVDGKSVEALHITKACLTVAEWAAASGYAATEYHFCVLGAYAAPDDADAAFAAGRAARRTGRVEDARSWFRRSISLARRSGDDAAYASAYLGWGILEERQGRQSVAERKFIRAWRAAKRGGLPELAGATRHNMIALALTARNFEAGNRHIIAAYKLYGPKNPLLYRLANDAAGFWSTLGLFGISLPLYEAALPFVTRADERMTIYANISRVAAALGERDTYLEAWDKALDLDREAGEKLPEVYCELARGAYALGYHPRAKDLASRAVAVAAARGGGPSEENARTVLTAIQTQTLSDPAIEASPELQRFVARFYSRLRQLRTSEN